MKKRKYSIWGAALIVAVGVVLSLNYRPSDKKDFEVVKNLTIFNSIVKQLNMFYVDTINYDKTIGDGIEYMLYGLDPYTTYFSNDNNDELQQMLNNSYGGIGSVITWNQKLKRSVIAEPYEGMPAYKAGLKAGDILMKIDGKDLMGKNNEEVSKMLRGNEGTEFKLTVDRPGKKKPITFDIVRRSVQLPYIPYYGEIKPNIGYINLTTFSGKPSEEFKRAFLDLKQKGITSLVIDLRNNGGGLLDEAVNIANFFLPKGKVLVTTKGRIEAYDSEYKTEHEPLDLQIPLVVLVNEGTASSSEILAGSLQDLDRAVIIGTRTFGKGLVQTTRQLPYNGVLKLTTAKYYIPSGRCVQAINYKNRKRDGSVERTPDSLTNVFHTAIGREVRDGGGIKPDIEIKSEKLPNILFYLIKDQCIFNFATEYCLKHPHIADAKEFKLTDKDYNDFIASVQKADFKYDQETEKMLKTLKEMAKFEGYYDGANKEFEELEKKLKHNLVHDLNYFKKPIKRELSMEIIKRYYYQKGGIIESLKDDDYIKEAEKVLNDTKEYKKILTPAE